MENDVEKLVLRFFEIEVVKFGDFKLKSGVQSPVYFDFRVIVSYPKLLESVTNLLVELIHNSINSEFQYVCGVPYTALPLATLVSVKSKIPMLIRRKEAKDHGTRKLIEGKFCNGEECIILEDVISSGSSIMETVKDLQKEGLKVAHAVVVLDREQGGVKNLQDAGIKVHVLLSLTGILKILLKHEKITAQNVIDTKEYISQVKLFNKEENLQCANGTPSNRLKMTFASRASLTNNQLTKRIFEIAETKKSLLCLAADVTNTSELLKLASQVGPHICILKTHFDILKDFSEATCHKLMKLSKNFNFLIMEDRKFSDIGNTVCLQYNQIKVWADLVTSHSIAGESILTALKSCTNGNEKKGCFLVAELSCQGHFISREYSNSTAKMAEENSDFVVGLVCQSPDLIKAPHLIQLTPGVQIEERSDNLGQNYSDPEYVVLEKGADIAVVGRGIVTSPNPEKAAITYKEKLWNAYQKRIS